MELISTPHTSSWHAYGQLHRNPYLDLIPCINDVFNGVVSATEMKQELNAEFDVFSTVHHSIELFH